ncbi:hypothetical protein QOZ80_7BG0603790 [Eleusine coracana subsp. coracana]|nr:hypothetical protein QOZ80_7BG0603790 [Eleusine coracana subsp. coracana]
MADNNEDLRGKHLGVFICWLLGIGCLIGFNSMMVIEDYYLSLFPKYHPTRLITLSYQPLVLVTTAIYVYYEARVNTRVRILAGYIGAFLFTCAIIIVDAASRGTGSVSAFVSICFIAGGFGIADGHVQGGLTGDLSFMCPEFLQSFFAGQAAAGAITSVLRFITKGAFSGSHDGLRKGAMVFCLIACLFLLTCVLLYAFVFPKLPIVKFYRSKAALEGSLTVTADLAAGGGGVQGYKRTLPEEDYAFPERMSGKQILLQNWDYALDVFLIYVLSLAIVPGFVAEDTGSHSLGSWYALVLIASFNVLDLVGSTGIKVG